MPEPCLGHTCSQTQLFEVVFTLGRADLLEAAGAVAQHEPGAASQIGQQGGVEKVASHNAHLAARIGLDKADKGLSVSTRFRQEVRRAHPILRLELNCTNVAA